LRAQLAAQHFSTALSPVTRIRLELILSTTAACEPSIPTENKVQLLNLAMTAREVQNLRGALPYGKFERKHLPDLRCKGISAWEKPKYCQDFVSAFKIRWKTRGKMDSSGRGSRRSQGRHTLLVARARARESPVAGDVREECQRKARESGFQCLRGLVGAADGCGE